MSKIFSSKLVFFLFFLTFIPGSFFLLKGDQSLFQKICKFDFFLLIVGGLSYLIENIKTSEKLSNVGISFNHNKALLVFLMFTILFIYWRAFLPHLHVANDLHVTLQPELKSQFSIPFVWSNEGAVGLGEFSAFGIWNWPVETLFGLLGILGFTHMFLNQFLGLGIGLIVAVVGINLLLKEIGLSIFSRYCAAVLFVVNSYLILLVDGGQLTIALAYLYFPMTYFIYIKSFDRGLVWMIYAAFLTTIIGIFDLRFLYLLFLLLGIRFLFFIPSKSKIKYILRWFLLGFTVLVTFVLLNAYWIIPALSSRGPSLPSTYGRASQTQFLNFTSLGHALLLQQPHWYLNVFGKISILRFEFVLFPILAFLAPFLKKNKSVSFWVLIALISVFLTKGNTEPFGQIYDFLFSRLPGFNLFRDSTKFFFLGSLAYSLLIGFSIDAVINITSKIIKSYSKRVILISSAFAIYLLFVFSPVWLGKMTGTFSPPIYRREYESINTTLRSDNNFGRVLWIPTKAPLGLSSPLHPALETSRLANSRPFAVGIVGAYETNNYLREALYMKDMMDIAAISYVAYPYPDTRRENLKADNIEYYFNFFNQLQNQDWSEKTLYSPPVTLIKTKSESQHIFLTDQNYWVIGSDRIYWDMKNEGIDLKNNGLIFTEEKYGILNNVGQVNENLPILLYKSSLTDVAALLVNPDDLISPASLLNFEPNGSGWWKRESADLVWWRDFLQQKYSIDNLDFDLGKGWAVSEGDLKLKVNSLQFKKDKLLLARVMISKRGGSVNFFQDGVKLGGIDTHSLNLGKVTIKLTGNEQIPNKYFEYDDARFIWFEVGKLVSGSDIEIRTEGEINVVNLLMSVDAGNWQKNVQEVKNLRSQGKIIVWEDLNKTEITKYFGNNNNQQVALTRINPTLYRVRITGLSSPTVLVFSESYDPLWEIKRVGGSDAGVSMPLYNLVNGFYVERDGEYEIYLKPQKYVLPGVYVSLISFAGLILTIVLLKKRKI